MCDLTFSKKAIALVVVAAALLVDKVNAADDHNWVRVSFPYWRIMDLAVLTRRALASGSMRPVSMGSGSIRSDLLGFGSVKYDSFFSTTYS